MSAKIETAGFFPGSMTGDTTRLQNAADFGFRNSFRCGGGHFVDPLPQNVGFGSGELHLAGRHLAADDFVEQQAFGCIAGDDGGP